MELILYLNNDSDNTINKTLVNDLAININLKREVNITTPSIVLASIEGVNFNDYNYAYIPELGRFYFVKNINNTNNRVWVLELECDVIETYKSDILNSNARFRRNIKNGDYLDASIDMTINKVTMTYESDKGFTGESTMIMTTVGA